MTRILDFVSGPSELRDSDPHKQTSLWCSFSLLGDDLGMETFIFLVLIPSNFFYAYSKKRVI